LVSVQVVQKTKTRKQRVVKSFGSARPDDTAAVERLMQAASSSLQEMEGPVESPVERLVERLVETRDFKINESIICVFQFFYLSLHPELGIATGS